jgi:hypothetical protein
MIRASTHLQRPAGTSFTKAWQQRGIQMQPVLAHWSQKTSPGYFG